MKEAKQAITKTEKNFKVAAACLNQTPYDWNKNRDNILAAILEAKNQNVKLLCCPELCISGYGLEDGFLSPFNAEIAVQILKEIVPETQDIMVAVGLPLWFEDKLFNTAALLKDGHILGFVAKQNLPSEGVHYEPRWFTPWPANKKVNIEIDNISYPLGDIIFEVDGFRIGFEICEDAWVPNRTGIQLATKGVDIILNPSASHFALGKSIRRQHYVEEGAKKLKVFYIYANLVGNESGRIIYDGDMIIADPNGIVISGPRFTFQDYLITSTTINLESLNKHHQSKNETNDSIDKKNLNHLDESKNNKHLIANIKIKKEYHDLEFIEFTKAASLGLFDYLRKSRASGFVLNLSGGSDSAACACLVYLMCNLALNELGTQTFQKKLKHIPEILNKAVIDVKSIMPILLLCLYQGSEFSSEKIKEAAFALAKSLNVNCDEVVIDSFVKSYRELADFHLQRILTWKKDNLALQNIQARVRSPLPWMIANVKNAIFLSTSNRSEASVGYMTMDGDTCGGLAPLAGVNKTFILAWLKWLETTGFEGVGKITALQQILEEKPTAELSPKEHQQTDETDLMNYELLDAIERLFIKKRLSPKQIFELIQQQNPSIKNEDLKIAIKRFFDLWTKSQWKRERIAPSFHLDDHSVDPKSWYRFPIFSGDWDQITNL